MLFHAVILGIQYVLVFLGDRHNHHDVCKGDMGGPAVQNGDILVGLISYPNCGHLYFTSLYTDVSKVESWIKEKLKNL